MRSRFSALSTNVTGQRHDGTTGELRETSESSSSRITTRSKSRVRGYGYVRRDPHRCGTGAIAPHLFAFFCWFPERAAPRAPALAPFPCASRVTLPLRGPPGHTTCVAGDLAQMARVQRSGHTVPAAGLLLVGFLTTTV